MRESAVPVCALPVHHHNIGEVRWANMLKGGRKRWELVLHHRSGVGSAKNAVRGAWCALLPLLQSPHRSAERRAHPCAPSPFTTTISARCGGQTRSKAVGIGAS